MGWDLSKTAPNSMREKGPFMLLVPGFTDFVVAPQISSITDFNWQMYSEVSGFEPMEIPDSSVLPVLTPLSC